MISPWPTIAWSISFVRGSDALGCGSPAELPEAGELLPRRLGADLLGGEGLELRRGEVER